jgi:hypothetical protein
VLLTESKEYEADIIISGKWRPNKFHLQHYEQVLRVASRNHHSPTLNITEQEEVAGVLVALRRPLCQIKLLVEVRKVDMRTCHRGHKRKNNGSTRLLGTQQIGACRFCGSPHLSPEVDLQSLH